MSIVKSLGSQWLAAFYVAAVSMLVVFTLGRLLGPEGFGVYSYILSAAAIYGIVLDGGYRTLLFREGVSESPEIFGGREHVLAVGLGHVLLATAIGFLLILFVPVPYRGGILAALACFALITISGLVSAELKGEGRFQAEAGWQTMVRTMTALLVVVAVSLLPTTPAVFIAWGLGTALALALPVARRVWQRRPSFNFHPGILRACLAFVLIDAATAIYFRSDIIMLAHLGSGEAAVGNYAAAYRLLEGVVLLAMPVAHIAFRGLRLQWENRDVFSRRLGLLVVGMAAASLVIAAAGFAFGPLLIRVTFGQGYDEAGALLGWLLCALFFVLPNFILTQGAIALNREGSYAIAAVAAAGLNVGLNIWLIPEHGALGAAWATLATEALLFVWLGSGLLRWLNGTPNVAGRSV